MEDTGMFQTTKLLLIFLLRIPKVYVHCSLIHPIGEQERATALVPTHDLPMIPTPPLHPPPSPYERTQKKKKGFLSDLWRKLKYGDRGKTPPDE